MCSTSKVAVFAFLAQRVTESEHSLFSPNCCFPPSAPHRQEPLVRPSSILDVCGGAFHRRHSARTFPDQVPTLQTAVRVLNVAYGYQDNGHRTVPSAGNYYALTLHLCRIEACEMVEVYRYDPDQSDVALSHRVRVPFQNGLFVHHVDFATASWFILWSCRLMAPASKYGAKAYRFICIEVGHSAQMAILECLSQGLPSIPLGGLNEAWLRVNVTRQGRRLLPQYGLLF